MIDSFNRNINYMRISITDRCNLRCTYCMPKGITDFVPMSEILTYEEILEIVRISAGLGISRYKITGGEPLVRKNCIDLIEDILKVDGVEQVTMTTNGVLLKSMAKKLLRSGISAVNVSLDTLRRDRFKSITGFDCLDDVLEGIRAVGRLGIRTKVNTVLQDGINDDEWEDILNIARDEDIDVRFIEMMPIGQGKKERGISNIRLREMIEERFIGVRDDLNYHGNGPAKYIKLDGFKGSVGFISAMHGKFCDECNRVRLTSRGMLKPCLCYSDCIDLRDILRNTSGLDRKEKLFEAIKSGIIKKPSAHCFENSTEITENRKMSDIGG